MSLDLDTARLVYSASCEDFDVAVGRLEKARRRLYFSSILTLVIFVTNAVPTKIEPLGIETTALQAASILPILSAISLYFLTLFVLGELKYQKTRVRSDMALSQLESLEGMGDPEHWTASTNFQKFWLFAGNAAEPVFSFLLIVVPLALGLAATLVGYFPSWFEWLKQILEAQISA